MATAVPSGRGGGELRPATPSRAASGPPTPFRRERASAPRSLSAAPLPRRGESEAAYHVVDGACLDGTATGGALWPAASDEPLRVAPSGALPASRRPRARPGAARAS